MSPGDDASERLTRRQVVGHGLVGAVAVATAGCGSQERAQAPTQTATTARAAPKPKPPLDPLRELARDVRGPLLRPRTSATLVYNQRYAGRRPRAVLQPRDARDVQVAVRWAQRHRLPLTVRSGGHSYAGYSTVSDGLVLDLRRLGDVHVTRNRVRVGGGAQLIDVHARLARHGGMLPTGSCPSVGVGGLSQGGGMGLSGRALGLTCDNVTGLTIVTPDGRLLRCDAESHEDLFWACRGGGGGNFGVVTSFEFRTHAARRGAWFSLSWPWGQADAALAAWQRIAPHTSDALTSVLTLTAGGGQPRIQAIGQHLGGERQLRALIAPLTSVAGAVLSTGSAGSFALVKRWAGCADIDLAACHTLGTTRGGQLARASFAASSAYVERPLSGAGRRAMLDSVERPEPGAGVLILDAYGGAINRVAADRTAFVHRAPLFCVQILSYFGADGLAAAARWKRHVARRLHPHATGAAYQNYIDPDLRHRASAYYGANLPRLREIKARVDPENLLRFAQSIRPTGA